jgi:tRNA threonylcarbamoyl adenosine modification protein (Sua5/YciO/YrdC/YwlC family)
MTAPLLAVDVEHPQPRVLDRAATLLRGGGLVCAALDGGYRLLCSAQERKAIDRLYALKRRDRKRPMSLSCSDLTMASAFAKIDDAAHRVLRKRTPGPFTFLLPATRHVPALLVSRQQEVGIRIPESALCTALIAAVGAPLVTTSATRPVDEVDGDEEGGEDEGEAFLDAADAREAFGHAVALVLDAGAVPRERSTVVSLTESEPVLVREGDAEF